MLDAVQILSDLIGIRTDNPLKENNDMIQYLISYFEKEKISCVRIKNQTGNLFNLIAGINVNDFQNISQGIILSCHLDTVPAKEEEWSENPFKAKIVNECVFGRGSVDMKQSIAVLLSLLTELKELQRPIFLCFTSDEETSCQGIKSIIHFFKKKNIKPEYAIVLEPTNLKIGIKNKGFKGFQTKIIGKACHSSQPEKGINALYIAARLVSFIEQTALLYQNSGVTLNVGVLNGGAGCNLVAPDACIDFEIRTDDDKKANEVITQIQAYHHALSKEYKGTPVTLFELDVMPAFNGNLESKLIPAIQKENPSSFVTSFDYATEAGFYQAYGIETVIFGPGDETLAHTNNEHIPISALLDFQKMLPNIIQNLKY